MGPNEQNASVFFLLIGFSLASSYGNLDLESLVGQLDLDDAIRTSLFEHNLRRQREETLALSRDAFSAGYSPENRHSAIHSARSSSLLDASHHARVTLGAMKLMADKFQLNREAIMHGLPKLNLTVPSSLDTAPVCQDDTACVDSKYRTVDGSCNNLKNKNWGKAGVAYKRMIPASYADGISYPRVSKAGSLLTSPRDISTSVFEVGIIPSEKHVTMLMQWGQFLAHDFALTPVSEGYNNTKITCCTDDGKPMEDSDLHYECMPIEIPANDGFFQTFERTCMQFVRSMPLPNPECKLEPRNQVNLLSAFLDGGNIYGSDVEKVDELRLKQDGKLKVQEREGDNLLSSDRKAWGCKEPEPTEDPICFNAGDKRVNVQPTLALMHTIWMRQHNKVAATLSSMHSDWTDENLYEEAKRITVAQYQHITFNEYLPALLGDSFGQSMGLHAWGSDTVMNKDQCSSMNRRHFHTSYQKHLDPTAYNAFPTAAMRYGHSTVPDKLEGFNNADEKDQEISLSTHVFVPSMLYNSNNFDSLLRGLVRQPQEKVDYMYSDSYLNKLYAGNHSFGMDLPALNIQRGRDHGLPSYTAYREACGLSVPQSFEDLEDLMDDKSREDLSAKYEDVRDIDLYVGGVLESPAEDAVVGPTFRCILGKSYHRLKYGDRYWYEHRDQKGSFTEEQLSAIKKTTLSRIICDNSEGIDKVQRQSFILPDETTNSQVSCSDEALIPAVDLTAWQNEVPE